MRHSLCCGSTMMHILYTRPPQWQRIPLPAYREDALGESRSELHVLHLSNHSINSLCFSRHFINQDMSQTKP